MTTKSDIDRRALLTGATIATAAAALPMSPATAVAADPALAAAFLHFEVSAKFAAAARAFDRREGEAWRRYPGEDEALRAAVDERFGLPALEAEKDRLGVLEDETIDRLSAIPATTIAGLAAKLRVMAKHDVVEDWIAPLFESALRDAERLAGKGGAP